MLYLGILFLWIVSTGYLRYGLFVEILSGIIVVYLIHFFRGLSLGHKILASLLSGLLVLQFLWAAHILYVKNLDWSWRPSFFENRNNYLSNSKQVLNDFESSIDSNKIDEIDVWFIFFFNVGHALSIKNNVPIINIDFASPFLPGWDKMESITSGIQDNFKKYKDKSIYTVVKFDQFGKLLDKLKRWDIRIRNYSIVGSPVISVNDRLVLVSLELNTPLIQKFGENLINDPSFEVSPSLWLYDSTERQIEEMATPSGKFCRES
ncbi:MAG: hypothetical protein IPK04_06495 [Bdellovibrionales bacterium]|nr:hypothetical protein [Bdellovibrionales bacterium]